VSPSQKRAEWGRAASRKISRWPANTTHEGRFFRTPAPCACWVYGWGLGLYGTLNRTALAGIVLAIWVFQVVVSPLWLRFFRFGPAEWLWRSLTYWQLQPMRA
jgi:hypothetical protein